MGGRGRQREADPDTYNSAEREEGGPAALMGRSQRRSSSRLPVGAHADRGAAESRQDAPERGGQL